MKKTYTQSWCIRNNHLPLMYKTYNMGQDSTYIMKALYRKDKFIKDLPSSDMYIRLLYNEDITNEEIILLECIMQLQKIHGNDFIFAFTLFSTYTRLSRRKFERAREGLVDKKIITVTDGGFKQPNKYHLNITEICKDLTLLYDLQKIDRKDLSFVMHDIRVWLTT